VPIGRPPAQLTRDIARWREDGWHEARDALAAEEPLEIRLAWQENGQPQRKSIAITMRTPGNDFELALGFLFGESIIRSADDVLDISYCPEEVDPQEFNIVIATLRPGLVFDLARLERNFFTTSSCGVCGKATLEALEIQGCDVLAGGFEVDASLLTRLPDELRQAQAVFEATGGLHAAALFTATGDLLDSKEDVGRHNALDKLIGAQLLAGRSDLSDAVLMLSGRASFELLQKALVARIPVVAAVGASSSLAIQLAEAFNITLAGFVRRSGFNVYTGRERIRA
jgi:FdhD protein